MTRISSWSLDRAAADARYQRGLGIYSLRDHGYPGDASLAFNALLAVMPAGATISVDPGLWDCADEVTVNKPCDIVCAPGATLRDMRPADGPQKLFNITAPNVNIIDPLVDGSAAPAGSLTQRHVCFWVGNGTTFIENVRISGARFLNLTRRGASSAGGTASLESNYGVLLTKVRHARVTDCFVDELSGCFAYAVNSENVKINGNHVEMDSSADCLYPIHFSGGNESCWAEQNYIKGGFRRSGGAIDVMSIDAPNKGIYVNRNIIDACNGDGSGTAVLRFLSVEDGELTENTVRAITTVNATYIMVNYRDLPTAQPGPSHNIVQNNILVCGGTDQRAIDVRNDHPAGTGGEDVTIEANQCVSDGANYFAAGIRGRDLERLKILDNTVLYKYSAAFQSSPGNSWGIDISGTVGTMSRPLVRGNEIDCFSIASSRGIEVQGTVNKPRLLGNAVKDWGAFGIRLENTVSNPTLIGNLCDGPSTTTAISNLATGTTTRRDNQLGGPSAGTWTIAAGASNVVVATTEVRTGDVILLTITTINSTDKPIKVSAIVDGTSFTVRTVDHTAVATNDMSGTWQIVH